MGGSTRQSSSRKGQAGQVPALPLQKRAGKRAGSAEEPGSPGSQLPVLQLTTPAGRCSPPGVEVAMHLQVGPSQSQGALNGPSSLLWKCQQGEGGGSVCQAPVLG